MQVKVCESCRRPKIDEAFWTNRDSPDALDSICVSCRTAHRAKKPCKCRRNKPECKTCRRRAANDSPRTRLIMRASRAVHYALRTGKLQKQPCEWCGDEKSEAHHPSYLRCDWLEVTWLCKPCHVKWHRHMTPIYPVIDIEGNPVRSEREWVRVNPHLERSYPQEFDLNPHLSLKLHLLLLRNHNPRPQPIVRKIGT